MLLGSLQGAVCPETPQTLSEARILATSESPHAEAQHALDFPIPPKWEHAKYIIV